MKVFGDFLGYDFDDDGVADWAVWPSYLITNEMKSCPDAQMPLFCPVTVTEGARSGERGGVELRFSLDIDSDGVIDPVLPRSRPVEPVIQTLRVPVGWASILGLVLLLVVLYRASVRPQRKESPDEP